MTTETFGLQTGQLPAPGNAAAYGLVHAIVAAVNPASAGVTYFQQGANVIAAFNKPGATGALDPPYRHCAMKDMNSIDPTKFSVGQATAGDGLFITYLIL